MSVSDPIADLITRLKNASTRGHPAARLPWTRTSESICHVLKETGYLSEVKKEDSGVKKELVVKLKYDEKASPAITGVERFSKPGVRRYAGHNKLPRVLGGLGIVVVSTPKGILSGKEAYKSHLGGEILFKIW